MTGKRMSIDGTLICADYLKVPVGHLCHPQMWASRDITFTWKPSVADDMTQKLASDG